MTSVRWMALLVAALFVPSAAAQIDNPEESTPTELYFHLFDTYNKFVINTQAMDAEFFEVGGSNFPTLDGTPVNGVLDADFDLNTVYGFSTAGPVEYDFIENGKPRFHPERGIAADVLLDQNVPATVYLYLDVKDLTGLDGFANAMPAYTFRVTMKEGDDPGDSAALDAGNLIMDGEVTVHIVDTWTSPGLWFNGMMCALPECDPNDPDDPDWFWDPISPLPNDGVEANSGFAGQTGPDGNPVLTPDAAGIVELAIPMTLASDRIPQDGAYNVRIDWFQEMGGAFGEDEFAEGFFRLAADPDHLPRLEMNIFNPVYISFIHPQVAAGTLLIHTGVNSPWGTYDIDADNITISVDGPTTPQRLEQVLAQNQHVHGLHHLDAEITYLWNFRDEGAANGDYTISMSVPNGAGTSVATGTAGFSIEGKKAFGISDEGEVVEPTTVDESEDSPAIGLFGLALLGFALLRRRA